MIGVEEAKRAMMGQVELLPEDIYPLVEATHHYLSHGPLASRVDHPPFNCSAVDGYAFRSDDRTVRRIAFEIAAGEPHRRELGDGECARIFTGAHLPLNADTVVMQEHVVRNGESIILREDGPKKGANVRLRGEQLRMGDIVLHRGSRFTPPVIGLLASAGYHNVAASRLPIAELVISGSEFAGGTTLDPGRIFSSNDHMLVSALRAEHVVAGATRVADDHAALSSAISAAIGRSDLLITTGGVSVGDHDLVRPVLETMGAVIHFHNVAQKPGKPMLFATLNGRPVFGLPGNPRAVMVLFWEYVVPFLRAMQGAKDPWLVTDHLPLAQPLEVKGDRAEFRAAHVHGGRVTLLRDEGSHMLRSLIDADALAFVPADRRQWKVGDPIEVHYLPR
ncbi:MAG: molybdopterin molybdotransferase MoeA [Flavobacteriales bacterium]|nr:molybdopterin molybdotransferase MoeA [Flavobacteriales bacterium]